MKKKVSKTNSNALNPPRNYAWLVAFLLGAFTMYIALSVSGVSSAGKYCILRGDMRTQLAPFFRDFSRRILNGESVYYSFSQFLGMDQTFYFAYCGIISPFTILYLLFPNTDFNLLTGIIVIIKCGLAAMTFQLFLQYALKIDGYISLIFSTFYALCSFQVACNLNNFVWMDAVFIFPVIILSIYILSNTGNFIPLCLSYTYIFIVQFYMGYMVGVISFLFFLGAIWLLTHKVSRSRFIIGYISATIPAILISGFIWLPVAYYLFHQYAEDAMQFETFFPNLLSFYSQLFFSNNVYANTKLPGLYCGNITVLLFPAFFLFCKENTTKKEKALYGGILLFLVISCFIPPIYQFMHAFDSPDGWFYRYSYILSFFLCIVAAKAMQSLHAIPKPYFVIVLAINTLISFLDYNFLKTFDKNWLCFGIGILIWIIWIGLCIFIHDKTALLTNLKTDSVQTKYALLIYIFIFLTSAECIGNCYSTYYKVNPGNTLITKEDNSIWENEQTHLKQFLSEDNSFYRVDYVIDSIYNSDSYSGYNGISDFSTAENPNVRTALAHLGYATSIRIITDYGATPVTNMLLGVKYSIHETDIYFPSETPIYVEENKYPLGIGYLASNRINNISFGENAFENNNILLDAIVGSSVETDSNNVYHMLPLEISTIENGLTLKKEEDHYSLIAKDNPAEAYIRFYIKSEDIPNGLTPCLYIVNEKSINRMSSMYILGQKEDLSSFGGRISMSYIRPFDVTDDGFSIDIYGNGQDEQEFKNYFIGLYDENALSDYYEKISGAQFIPEIIKSGYVKGSVQVTDMNQNILFTTIPYEDGWKINVNGIDYDYYSVVDDAFLAMEFPKPGTYEIEMKYTPKWLKEGVIITIIGILLFSTLVIIQLKKNHK